ncbi:MAG: T9SS type A sorting domain-containing protein [Bacteroidota bacterium]
MRIYILPLFIFIFTAVYTNAQVTSNAGSDQSICFGDTLKLEGTGLDPKDTGTYQWRDGETSTVLSNKSSLSMRILSMDVKQFILKVTRVTYKGTFIDDDTVEMSPRALPTFKYNPLAGLCYMGGPINLTQRKVALALPDSVEVTYYQKYKNPSWITGGPVGVADFIYDFQKNISNSQVPSVGLKDTICYHYTDQYGCYNHECKAIRLNQTPIVSMNDGIFCQKAGLIPLDNLVSQPSTGNRIGGIQSWRCITVPQNSGVDPDSIISDNGAVPIKFYMDPGQITEPEKSGDYILEYCFQNATTGCKKCDSVKVTVVHPPKIKFKSIPSQCINYPLLALDSFVVDKSTGKPIITGTWECVEYGNSRDMNNNLVKMAINNSVKNQKYFNPATISPNGGQYLLKFKDVTSGCTFTDSVIVNVNGLPYVNTNCRDTLCSKSSPFTLQSNYPNSSPDGFWIGKFVDSGKFYPDKAFAADGEKKYSIKYLYINPLTKCANIDSCAILVLGTPVFDFQWVKVFGTDSVFDFTLNVNGFDSTEYKVFWNFGNGQTSNYKQPTGIKFKLLDTTQITCNVTLYKLCSDTLTKELNVYKTGLKEFTTANEISIFPNPSSGKVQIRTQAIFKLQILDITGKEIVEGDNLSEVQLPQGFYLFKFTSGDQVAVKKVIIR